MKKIFDCAILGGGIAGVSAALYTRRAGLESFLFEPKAIGGQLLFMERVDNYPGLAAGTKGSTLAAQLVQTVKELGDGHIEDKVCGLALVNNLVTLRCAQDEYSARSVIIATGASFRKLGLSREIELTGRGVSYCAICDGFFFRGKDVAVIGGGNSALEEALYLARLC
ncbi:MAG: FAD-dependent oxidoreductase, partial [Candidatus Omnitrophica bacterium]|nr:FAD-dependent oxidoreductase [Candidatus Omnitrophota bacterium]